MGCHRQAGRFGIPIAAGGHQPECKHPASLSVDVPRESTQTPPAIKSVAAAILLAVALELPLFPAISLP